MKISEKVAVEDMDLKRYLLIIVLI